MDKMAALHRIFSCLGMLARSTSLYMAGLKTEDEGGFRSAEEVNAEIEEDEKKDESGATPGSPSGALSDVKLAVRHRMLYDYSLMLIRLTLFSHRVWLPPQSRQTFRVHSSAEVFRRFLFMHDHPNKEVVLGSPVRSGFFAPECLDRDRDRSAFVLAPKKTGPDRKKTETAVFCGF